jgi:hypothetical protein
LNVKNRCALFVIVLCSLLTFGVANADIEFAGVIDLRLWVIQVDSVSLESPHMTILTPGWGEHPSPDTFVFAGVTAWPETLVLHGIVSSLPLHWTIVHPEPDRWYPIGFSLNPPYLWLYGTGYGVEESRPLVAPTPRLAVSPSVVTGQMSVRLQPVGTGRPVVEIYDATGNVVRSLDCTAGTDDVATATWNREDDHGRLVPEGIYFCRYAASDVIAVRKVLVAH